MDEYSTSKNIKERKKNVDFNNRKSNTRMFQLIRSQARQRAAIQLYLWNLLPKVQPKDSIPQPPSLTTILSHSTLQVRNELPKIEVRKASGPDGISLRRCCTDQLCGIMGYMFPEAWSYFPQLQAGESSTAVEDLRCGTSAIDYTSKGPHQLQAGSTDRASHKDPWEAVPKISHPV